jgi:hypothetical protein
MTTLPNDTLYKTWEFQGIEIKPLSNARKFHLTKLVDFSKITPWDIAVLVYALICDSKILTRGLRDLDYFNEEVTKWIDSTNLAMGDFDEKTLEMIKEVLAHSDSNKVSAITDPSMAPDPMGNG